MTVDPTEDPHDAAMTRLEWLGLSTNTARTSVGLVGVEVGTAKEVSRVANVPRIRMYDDVEELLTERDIEELEAAADRDVPIRLGGVSPTVHDRILDTVPAAEPFDTLWLRSETTAGRIVMVDRERALVSVRGEDEATEDWSVRPPSWARARRTASSSS